jgi:hypothetical protein
MANELIRQYEKSLAGAFGTLGYKRVASGLYAQSDDQIIWRGIAVSFNSRKPRVIAQPSLQIFCPSGDKLIREGLDFVYPEYRKFAQKDGSWAKLGLPAMTHPLYDLVYRSAGKDRSPFSYDVSSPVQIESATELIRDDFVRMRESYFGEINSLTALRERLSSLLPWPTARMWAIVTDYLINGGISAAEINKIATPESNEMTLKFADYFKKRFARRS